MQLPPVLRLFPFVEELWLVYLINQGQHGGWTSGASVASVQCLILSLTNIELKGTVHSQPRICILAVFRITTDIIERVPEINCYSTSVILCPWFKTTTRKGYKFWTAALQQVYSTVHGSEEGRRPCWTEKEDTWTHSRWVWSWLWSGQVKVEVRVLREVPTPSITGQASQIRLRRWRRAAIEEGQWWRDVHCAVEGRPQPDLATRLLTGDPSRNTENQQHITID